MYDAAAQKNVLLQDGVWTRFFPAVEHARTLVEEGNIGDVLLVITLERPAHCPTKISIRIPISNGVPSQYRGSNTPSPVQRFEYPIPISSRMATASPNQHGFIYQAEAIHRSLAAGLHQCPQYNKEESLHSMNILTEINVLRFTRNGY